MALKKGYDPNRAKGGARKNAGRHPDWLKEKCQKIIERAKLVEFLESVATGKMFTQPGGEDTIVAPAPIRERIKATEILFDRCYGKVPQPTEITGKDGDPVVIQAVVYAAAVPKK